MSIDATEQLL